MYLDGFKFWLAYTKGTKRYYRCCRSKSSKCPGKLIMENSKVHTLIPHDHDKEIRNNSVEKFRKVLTRKAIEKPNKPLVDIYLEETLNHSEASILYPFTQAETTMRKARSKVKDKVEVESKKIEEIEKNSTTFKSHQHQKYFYSEEFNGMSVIVMNQGTLKTLGAIEEIHIDCALKMRIKFDENLSKNLDNFTTSTFDNELQSENNFYFNDLHLNNQQNTNEDVNEIKIITILALIKGRDCAIAFGMLKNLNFHKISSFLHYVKHKILLNPATILTSPNELLQSSIKFIYPDVNVKIMYFYYAQSTLKMVKNFKEISKNVFYLSSLKMILAMPLIPTNYVLPGFEALRKWMSEKNVNLQELCEHVYDKWLAENAEKISIFNGLAHTIENHTQNFNRDLMSGFDGSEMKIDDLIERISRQASKNFVRFNKNNVKKTQKLQKTVKFATKSWISSPFHLRRPIQFLQQVSHCIDDVMINFVMNFDENLTKSKETIVAEPPPLVFFDKNASVEESCVKVNENVRVLSSEPPPLVFIKRK